MLNNSPAENEVQLQSRRESVGGRPLQKFEQLSARATLRRLLNTSRMRFMDLVDEYIDMMSERAAKEIEKEVRDADGKDVHGKV